MQGVDILNKTEVTMPNDDLIITCFMLLGIALILTGLGIKVKNNMIKYIFFSGVVLCLTSALILINVYKDLEIPSGRYQYEAVIQDDVSINEVYEHYKVIDRKGKIWILEDKESAE